MKQIKWKDKIWWWPEDDTCQCRVIEEVKDLSEVIPLVKHKNGAIQSGGNTGVWAAELSQYFRKVFTFEPEAKNFECLLKNIKPYKNVFPYNYALGEVDGFCAVSRLDMQLDNCGAYFTTTAKQRDGQTGIDITAKVTQVNIDNFKFNEPIDLIQLDVEGAELPILKGAIKTIKTYRPVIMVEDKHLIHGAIIGHIPGQIEKFLKPLKYKVALKLHRDIVFTPEPSLVAA